MLFKINHMSQKTIFVPGCSIFHMLILSRGTFLNKIIHEMLVILHQLQQLVHLDTCVCTL